ncbi:DEAD/DEAH box helicase family protein [Leucobacter sp. cx-328]|uniref:restriction endonuclease n=1 Tax=unclassified Leucobacter TaxID=2621730 RepID=UPI00165DEC1B|nr:MULTISPECIES: DEAD/DEAH box helicase family protein [unclassified Leucobacter]MBC9944359.1 DEAD/DEAH box helicase family protein [Leucobacter sp. cx-328]
MKFRFDDKQPFQLDAISAVVDLFDGQPKDAEKLEIALRGKISLPESDTSGQAAFDIDPSELAQEVGAVGNNLIVERDTVLANLRKVQNRNGLELSARLAEEELGFDIEMETGTGKTYVYLRTIFELAQKYNFTKFVILVPSVAIREGVNTSIELMREHFRGLYPALPFDSSVYSGKSAEEVQSFATATNVQILVMTIDSIRGDANSRIIHQTRDKLQGLRPIDYLKATRPVVIMDEPQNMESKLSQSAVGDLSPTCTLRYSATHRKTRNVVYRLDPVDAHDKGLVKQIVVAEARQQGADATPYIKLVDVQRDPWTAKLELLSRKADGSFARTAKKIKQGQDLAGIAASNNPIYEGWRVNEIGLESPDGSGLPFVELTKHPILNLGEEIGGNSQVIYREMIRETIREHLRKEAQMRPRGVKVLSLFFIDKVANFLGDGVNNEDANGQYVQWFDELLREERDRVPAWSELLPEDPQEYRKAYFAQMKSGKGKAAKLTFVDSKGEGTTAKDDDAYDLIMKDKGRLLSEDTPTRFIFSHSALREGWDNPNVFQICTLREMGGETERRQTIGRGLRLPVNKDGERIAEPEIAQLTVIANESYAEFAKSLQDEYKKAGVQLGFVRKGEFAQIPVVDGETEKPLGFEASKRIYELLQTGGFLDKDGRVTDQFAPTTLGFDLGLPVDFAWATDFVIELVDKCKLDKLVKPKKLRASRQLNKEFYWSDEFEDFWYAISRKTTYRVKVDREDIISTSLAKLRDLDENPRVEPLRIQVTKAGLKIQRGGAKAEERGVRTADLRGSYDLPDIITELQDATKLTRRTIVDILTGSERLDEFIGNPNDFITMARRVINAELAKIIVDGVEYERISGSVYELRELREDSKEEADRFLDQLYKVQNQDKTDFDYVLFDSDIERQFAELLDGREDVKMFMKLPAKFKIDTPVGPYNPDWAIVKHEDGEDRIYMVRETKSTANAELLRPTEKAKIKAARAHFKALNIDYAKSSPGRWNL